MKINEIIAYESPGIIQDTDFGLTNTVSNIEFGEKLLSKKVETVWDNPKSQLFRTGENDGYIALLNKKTKRLDYVVKYTTSDKKLLGKTVTQVALWRRFGPEIVQGITKIIFFDYLLKNIHLS